MSKNFFLLAALNFIFLSIFGQEKNPFKSIGKKGEVLTLSKGQYDEFFDQEDVQQIGSVLVNIRTQKIVKLLSDQEANKRLDNTISNRFLSVDPITKKYPELTPYQFASNSPISGVDLDGLEHYFAADGKYMWKFGSSTQVRLVNDQFVEKNRGKTVAVKDINANSTDIGITSEELYTRAFLATVRTAERDGNGPLGYDVLFGGASFTGKDLNKDKTITTEEKFADHPRTNVTKWGLTMDVAGAYQFKSSSWDRVKSKLNLKDFSPASQDQGALQLIRWQEQYNPRSAGVTQDIKTGKIYNSVLKLNGTWTSLPGGNEELISQEDAQKIFRQNVIKELQNQSTIETPKGGIKL